MNTAAMLLAVRRRTALSRRELARRAGTSAATVAAYESERVVPGVDTLDRLLAAAGFDASVSLTRRYSGPERAAELLEVLELAEHFPARHRDGIAAPSFPGPRR